MLKRSAFAALAAVLGTSGACDVEIGPDEIEDEAIVEETQALTPWAPPYSFPSRGLAAGHYWRVDEFSEGENILDLDMVRWDDERNRWTARVDGVDMAAYNADKTNDKHLVHGMPLYAPVDGRIKSCWRNFPENPQPGVKLDEVTGANGTTKSIFLSGNHVTIEADDGTAFLVSHMMTGSVPSSLCPFNGTSASVYKSPGSSYPDASLIPEADRPVVKRGDFIGRGGNSGNSSGPHTHLHVKQLVTTTQNGATLPMPWFAAWSQPYALYSPVDADDWVPMDGDPITATLGNTLLWPSPFLRRGSATDYDILDVDSVAVSGIGVLTAARDTAGNLQLSTWDVSPDGDVTEVGSDSAGSASEINVAHPSSTRDVVVALRTGSGSMKLIFWDVASSGGLTRKGSDSAGGVSKIDMVRSPTGATGVVTAVRTSSGLLKVIAWAVNGSAGTIDREGSDTAGAVTTVAATRLVDGRTAAQEGTTSSRFQGVVTASVAGGDLQLNTFQVGSGLSVTHRDSYTAGPITLAAIGTVRTSALRELIVTAVRTTSGDMKLIAWEISAAGTIYRLGSVYAGGIKDVEIQSGGTGALITAVRRPGNDLKLIAWELTADGEFRRLGDSTNGDVLSLSLSDRILTGGRTYFATPVRLVGNALKVIAFETNL